MRPWLWTALIDRVRDALTTERVGYAPTLVVNRDPESATRLSDRLQQAGLAVEVATSCWAAQAAMRVRFYGSLVCFVDPRRAADLECVARLRRRSGRSWIILVSSPASTNVHRMMACNGADAILTEPYTTEDLVRRLAAFSRRSRPIY